MAKKTPPPVTEPAPPAPQGYTVLARRYRPQAFDQLVGQEHVARSLENAIKSGRVAHAYLFTGARGVGKTSTARILAKSLNCEHGPTPTPCGTCAICQSIAAGDDVDVLEIDGASNRRIDEVRDIRANVQYRPSRSASSSAWTPSPVMTCRSWSAMRSLAMPAKSKRWQRDRIVIGTFWTSVVAKMNLTWGGGSSNVFSRALKAWGVSMWTSSMM